MGSVLVAQIDHQRENHVEETLVLLSLYFLAVQLNDWPCTIVSTGTVLTDELVA